MFIFSMEANVVLTTILSWPNQFLSPAIITTPADLNISSAPVLTDKNCPTNTKYSSCQQTIAFKLKLSTDCDFDGMYKLNATVVTCRDNIPFCTKEIISAVFYFNNSDVCGGK